MIRMLIVDDELIIRRGLMSIPWENFEIEVVGDTSSGESALELAKEVQPDILLTDIRMPGMDGLQLIKAMKEQFPYIKSILLSGYQDFNYARTALCLGATAYVLKPSDPDEIIDAVIRARDAVLAEAKERNTIAQAEKVKFLRELLYGRFTDAPTVLEKCKQYNCIMGNYAIMLLEYHKTCNSSNNHAVQIEDEISRVTMGLGIACYLIHADFKTLCLVVELPDRACDYKERMLSLAIQLRDEIFGSMNSYISIGISQTSNQAFNMNMLFNQAHNCLKLKFSLGKGAIIHVEDLKVSIDIKSSKNLISLEDIIQNFKRGNYRETELMTRELLFYMANEQREKEEIIKSICFNLLVSCARIISEEIDETALYDMLANCTDIMELEECVVSTLLNYMEQHTSRIPATRNKIIQDILEYIDKSYMNEISLISIAEYVHMNHIYISRLIKRETGSTFLDILTKLRMDKACELLENPEYKTYEVSRLIGIEDSGYFSQLFKKNFGITPSEYREKIYGKRADVPYENNI